LRDAALQLGISFPTIKQWIYKKKIRSIQTAGGHHRIPRSEVDKLLFRTRGGTEKEREQAVRRVSGRNQLVGRIDSVRISGLMAEVKISIGGQQITSIITATSAREMQLKAGQTAAALIVFVFALGLTLQTTLAASQQLTVQIVTGKQTVLTRADIEALPRVKVTTAASGVSTTFEGSRFGQCWKKRESGSARL